MKAYFIREYNMVGDIMLYTYEESFLNESNILKIEGPRIFLKSGVGPTISYWHYSTEPIGAKYKSGDLLPYMAAVTEDIPSRFGFPPKVYPNCQLMHDRKSSYKFFKCLDSGEELLIGMNSHTYEPILLAQKDTEHLIPVHINVARCSKYYWNYSEKLKSWVRGEEIPEKMNRLYNVV